jgi:hypothetical protein
MSATQCIAAVRGKVAMALRTFLFAGRKIPTQNPAAIDVGSSGSRDRRDVFSAAGRSATRRPAGYGRQRMTLPAQCAAG